ncbi:hypothetical protein Tco_1115871 [Tanacetum coccineum]
MLHGIFKFDGHPFIMTGFHRNIEGIGPHMVFVIREFTPSHERVKILYFLHSCFGSVGIVILQNYLDKHHVTIFFFGANEFSVGRWGTNKSDLKSDLKSELNLRTFSVTNEIDGSGGVGESGWFSGLPLSSSFSSVLSWESLCCLGWIVIALIEL